MINMLPFNLPNLAGPTVTNQGSNFPLAGGYADKDRLKELQDLFGSDETGKLIAANVFLRDKESSPGRLKEQLEVLGPYLKDVARENQRLAMEANLFAGILDIPNKFSRAMAEQYRYFPETMEIVGRSAQPRPPLPTRQYINL